MKKIFLILLLTAVCIFTGCNTSNTTETEGTNLVVPKWVDNVYSVALESKNGQGVVAVHKADSCMAYEYFSGQVTLRIDYNDLSDAEKETYLGYGVLDGAANPFKVFVNGREVENESKKASVPHGDNVAEEDILYLNAYVDCFEYTFSITEDVKTVTITFENAPELIPCDKLRLDYERPYAYVDVSELEKSFDDVKVWNADGTSFNRIPKGLYLFDKYIEWSHHNNYNFDYHFFITFKTKNGTFSDTDSFVFEDESCIESVHKIFDNSCTQCTLFVELKSILNGGTILKITGVNESTTPVIKYIGTKAPTVAKEVGDIVFNDGSATPYTTGLTFTDAQKDAAIALIFYKGTGLNSGDDTTTSRTLGVGLNHNRSGLAWCTSAANAYRTKITTIQCLHDGSDGALTFTGDKDGSNNLEQIGTYLTSNSSSDDTATVGNYPAFYFAKNYSTTATNLGTAYANGWYLPSIAELFQIYANGKGAKKVFDIDAASQALGGDSFGTSSYWSSSQDASDDGFAHLLWFNNGHCLGEYKGSHWDGYGYVCAIRAFN